MKKVSTVYATWRLLGSALLGEFCMKLSIIVLHYMTQGPDFCHNFFTQFKCNDEFSEIMEGEATTLQFLKF